MAVAIHQAKNMTCRPAQILVCQAGSCRRAGGRGTLFEIEDLAAGLAECRELHVEGSGCQGNCNQAPSALVIFNPDPEEEEGQEEKLFSRVSTLESSQLVVEFAAGLRIQAPSPEQSLRLQIAGAARSLEAATEACKWNQALGCIVRMEAFKQSSMHHQEDMSQLVEKAEILNSAGYCQDACGIMEELVRRLPGSPRILLLAAEVLTSAGSLEAAQGRVQEVLMRAQSMPAQVQRHWTDAANEQLLEIEGRLLERKANGTVTSNASAAPNRGQVEGYSRWRLAEVRVLSVMSALYVFKSLEDAQLRGLPQLLDKRGKTLCRRTWHTTLLAEVGQNKEGPLRFVECDCTLVSSDAEPGRACLTCLF